MTTKLENDIFQTLPYLCQGAGFTWPPVIYSNQLRVFRRHVPCMASTHNERKHPAVVNLNIVKLILLNVP